MTEPAQSGNDGSRVVRHARSQLGSRISRVSSCLACVAGVERGRG